MLLASLILVLGRAQIDAPRLRVRLDNGATVIVEHNSSFKMASVAIVFRSDRCKETPDTHGWRHLLEHVAARGSDGKLEQRLERLGWMTNAWTYRDSMVFAAIGPAKQTHAVIDLVASIPLVRGVKKEVLDIEKQVILHELALLTDAQRLTNHAWLKVFEDDGLDGWGKEESILKADLADIARLATQQFDARGMVVAVAGPVEIGATMRQATAAFGKALQSEWPIIEWNREASMYGDSEVRAIPLPAAGSPQWVASVGAALALEHSSRSEATVSFAISFRRGLLTVMPATSAHDRPSSALARRAFAAWVSGTSRSPFTRALLLAQLANASPDLTPEKLADVNQTLSADLIDRAAAELCP